MATKRLADGDGPSLKKLLDHCDQINISMDVYEVTFPDAPPGSIHEKVKSDAPVQYSASLVAKLLGEALPRPVRAVVDKRYELEREQLEEEVAMEDCV